MAYFIDSANLDDISEAVSYGWVTGVTTNPLLLAREELDAEQVLLKIKRLTAGPIFYQLMAKTQDEMLVEAKTARDILGDQLVVKIPPVVDGFRFCCSYSSDYACCLTALFSLSQIAAARETGAR